MKRSRVSVRAASVIAAAAIVAVIINADRVLAGISSAFTVDIIEPADPVDLTVYTPDADVPPSIPIGVRSLVNETVRGIPPFASDVETSLGGTRNGGTVTGALQRVDATLVHQTSTNDEYLAVVDAALLDFEPVTRGTSSQFASDIIRTIAAADGYYAFDEIGIDVGIQDLSLVDSDGNLIPDATALFQPFLLLMDGAGNITIVISLNDTPARGGEQLSYELSVNTVLGPMTINLAASSLSEIIAQSGGALSAFNTGRLIVTLSDDAGDTLDGPAGVDPISEFDLEDDLGPLPPPQNLFARVNVALTSVARGVAPTWTFLETLPGTAFFSLQLNGPGIADLLEDGVEVGGYTYNVDMTQNGENITVEQPDDAPGWEALAENFVLTFNLDNADDSADGLRITVADDGDDTIVIRSNNTSAIFGSNAVPRIGGGGGGGDGGCFIATAAYGTPLAHEIDALRDVRDRYMLSNAVGSVVADAYYRLSPGIAGEVAQNVLARQAVRLALAPAIAVSGWLLASPLTVALALAACGALGSLFWRTRRKA